MNTKFKQTEIGEIPEEWDVVVVEDFADVIGGGTPSTNDEANFNGDIPWITPRDLSSWTNKRISRGERSITVKGLNGSGAKLLPKDTVLLTSRAPVGYVAIADNQVATNQGFKSLVPKDISDPDFLYYMLKNNTERLINNSSGSTFQELSGGVLRQMVFALPKRQDQQQIASILSSLDDKIELNRKMNKTLEDMAKVLFKHWFVDFEFPDENGKPYKSGGGEMVESELGPIPKGWKVIGLPKVADIQKGLSYKGSGLVESSKVGLVGLKCFERGGGFRYDGVKYYKGEHKAEHCLQSGDLVIAMTDLTQAAEVLGKPALIPTIYGIDVLIASLDLSILKPKTQQLDQHFLYLLFDRQETQDFLFGYSNGSTVLHLSMKGLQEMKMTKPTDNVLTLFQKLVDPMFFRITEQKNEINRLTTMRDSLLPKLMSGRIRV